MINNSKVENIQQQLKKAIEKVEKDNNVKISFGNITYNNAYYTTKMKVISKDDSSEVSNVFELICKRLGFTQNIIGMQFKGRNGIFEIVDIKTRNHKYPVIAESKSDGKMYKYTVKHVKSLIGGDKIINRNANLDKLLQ
jgi:hypothetical protein